MTRVKAMLWKRVRRPRKLIFNAAAVRKTKLSLAFDGRRTISDYRSDLMPCKHICRPTLVKRAEMVVSRPCLRKLLPRLTCLIRRPRTTLKQVVYFCQALEGSLSESRFQTF